MRNRAIHTAATILSVFLLAATAQAGPVLFGEVVHNVGGAQNGYGQELRVRSVSQMGSTPVKGNEKAATVSSDDKSSNHETITAPTSLISTVATPQEGSADVQVIQEGDVTGTVCDCGEILIPGGWPKWPLAFLPAAVCLIPDLCDKDKKCPPGDPQCSVCPPGDPACKPPEIPEPASLLLLGTGLSALGAGARRRYRARKSGESVPDKTEA